MRNVYGNLDGSMNFSDEESVDNRPSNKNYSMMKAKRAIRYPNKDIL